jgi:glycosyltransferase involved in cell wall biosynthesis
MTDKTLVSVLIPSYNHEAYIEAAIRSVLDQTHRNIQVVIVDDASSDGSSDVVRSIKDDRIEFRQLSENVGACLAMNIGLSMCIGEFVAVCNSDDIWIPTKLEQQLKQFQASPTIGAVFSDVEWIDDFGRPLAEANVPAFEAVFRQPNRSRFSWIRDLIEGGNCLCHPSVLIRREVYDNVGAYNNYYRQLPDLDMWLRLLQCYDILVMPDKLVKFRIHLNNTSRPTQTTSNRSINEHRLILVDLMKNIGAENFYSAFGFTDLTALPDKRALKFEIARYLLDHRGGFQKMFNQLGSEMMLEIPQAELARRGVTAHDFHKEVGRSTPWISESAGYSPEAIREPPQGPTVLETPTIDLIKIVLRRLRSRFQST